MSGTGKPWERFPVGSKKWVDAHIGRDGILHISGEDLKLLKETRVWQEGLKKFKEKMQKLYREIEKKRV